MKISETIKLKKGRGYVWIDTTSLDSPVGNMLDGWGFGNNGAIGHPFETMVFKSDKDGNVEDWDELDKENYDNEKQAEKGHKQMVDKWKKK